MKALCAMKTPLLLKRSSLCFLCGLSGVKEALGLSNCDLQFWISCHFPTGCDFCNRFLLPETMDEQFFVLWTQGNHRLKFGSWNFLHLQTVILLSFHRRNCFHAVVMVRQTPRHIISPHQHLWRYSFCTWWCWKILYFWSSIGIVTAENNTTPIYPVQTIYLRSTSPYLRSTPLRLPLRCLTGAVGHKSA
jgi:hypothetical protein